MRIVIEIDGVPVVATEVPTAPPYSERALLPSAEPPPELARAARARDAQSAGPAAFFRPDPGEFRAPTMQTPALVSRQKPADLAAGAAAAISTPQPAKISPAPRKRPSKRAK